MPQPTLGERFRNRAPARGPEDRHAWLTADEKRFILWALRDEWSAARIGRTLGVNEATVRRFRQRFLADPLSILELGLFEMVGAASNEEYRCLVCGDRVHEKRDVERHVLGHYAQDDEVNSLLPRRRRRSKRGEKGQPKRAESRR